jgi:hypothetical protein
LNRQSLALGEFIEQFPQLDTAISERRQSARSLQMLGNESRKLLKTLGIASRHVIIESAAQVPREHSAKCQDRRENDAQ